ncbi:MAG: molybdopterin-dependent oxidoreductase, partial [Actinomycetota bacterium]|nr:molybdopterin-dependent oxidoreductase [Actinomycetota bacterium]
MAGNAMVCGFCSVGCSLDVNVKDGVAVSLKPTKEYPVNLGMACPKGWEALTPLRAPDRATSPLLRAHRGGPLEPVYWPTALDAMVSRFKAVQSEHGPEAAAFLSTGQIASEEMALLGALAKFGMGMVHGDGNTRQCMATAVVAYKESFGFDAPPYTYGDLEESDVIVLWGANPCIAHPILWERICRNPHHPEVIVVDPRVTETAAAATQHYPLLPKSDLTLLYGLAHLLIAWGAVDKEFVARSTDGFEGFAAHVEAFTPERVSAATGLPVDALELMADTIASGKRVSFWWTMGVNQSHEGVRVAQAIIGLALLTGNVGRPGTGANSITGQCNAMGSRLWSNTTNLFGGRAFTDPDARAEVAEILNIESSRIPDRMSLAYDQIIEGIRHGKIKALWVIATNSAHSWIDQRDLVELFGRLDVLVVQDLYTTTETAQLADIVLPAAGWGEKEGTFINSERRYGRIRRVVRAPGQALADFSIFKLVADAWGCGDMFEEWSSPEAVFRILQRLSAGRPCDITGIEGYGHLDAAGGIQWPLPATGTRVLRTRDPRSPRRQAVAGGGGPSPAAPPEPAGVPAGAERRLFEDGIFFHSDGRARFVWEEPRPVAEPTGEEFPFILLTGRGSSSQWHTQTRTSKSAILRTLYPEKPYVEISPADASALGVAADEWVVVRSARGEMEARAYVTPTVAPGQVFVPMHYAKTNQLTKPS